jgi:hypothetical protein
VLGSDVTASVEAGDTGGCRYWGHSAALAGHWYATVDEWEEAQGDEVLGPGGINMVLVNSDRVTYGNAYRAASKAFDTVNNGNVSSGNLIFLRHGAVDVFLHNDMIFVSAESFSIYTARGAGTTGGAQSSQFPAAEHGLADGVLFFIVLVVELLQGDVAAAFAERAEGKYNAVFAASGCSGTTNFLAVDLCCPVLATQSASVGESELLVLWANVLNPGSAWAHDH